MPFADANLGMVVPAIDMKRKSAWTFLKPWSWGLRLGTSCFCLFIGFVVWLLQPPPDQPPPDQHPPDQPPPNQPPDPNNDHHVLYQIGTFVLLCFPIVYLTNAERVRGNLSKFVLIMWIVLLGILTQSYLANLETEYAKLNVKPVVTDINHLLKKGENVGYIAGAYTLDLLRWAGFDRSKLKGFETMEEIDQALSKGSAKGGIGAFVGGNFHMNLFVQKYCSKYIIVSNVIKTLGYGLVLKKRNPILSDISQAILNLRGGEKMISISNRWFKKEGNCQKLVPSDRLGFDSFLELFLVVFTCSIFAIICNLIDDLTHLKTLWSNLQAYVRNKITTM